MARSLFGKNGKHKGERSLRLINKDAPFSFTEAYKSLRTNIDYLATANNLKTFLITSAGPWDGKTTVAINLAISMANSGKKVILVDCDLRKGTVASYLKIERRHPGVTEFISKKVSIRDALVYRKDLNLYILPAGMLPASPAEIAGMDEMGDLIRSLSDVFDYVFIDTPPVSIVTDAAIMCRFVDGVLLVARADETTKQALALARKKLDDVNANVLGVILNDYNAREHSYGNGYYYSYSYRYKSYGGYGKRGDTGKISTDDKKKGL